MLAFAISGEFYIYRNIGMLFDVFPTVHHSIELFHQPTLMHNFLYSLTICLLHYYPRQVPSFNMPIFRRKNYIHTASGIFALELSERSCINMRSTVLLRQYWSESALINEVIPNKCCVNTIFPPEDGHVNARNMSRIIV